MPGRQWPAVGLLFVTQGRAYLLGEEPKQGRETDSPLITRRCENQLLKAYRRGAGLACGAGILPGRFASEVSQPDGVRKALKESSLHGARPLP